MAPLLRACSTIARAGRTVLALRPPCSAAAHAYFQVPALSFPRCSRKTPSGMDGARVRRAWRLCFAAAARLCGCRRPRQGGGASSAACPDLHYSVCTPDRAGQVASKAAPIALGSAGTTGAWGAAKIGSVPSCARRRIAGGIVLSPAFVDVACARLGAHLALSAPHPATRPRARTFFTRFAQQRQLQSLEKEAAAYPSDAAKQAEYLKKLNTHDPEAVLRR